MQHAVLSATLDARGDLFVGFMRSCRIRVDVIVRADGWVGRSRAGVAVERRRVLRIRGQGTREDREPAESNRIAPGTYLLLQR